MDIRPHCESAVSKSNFYLVEIGQPQLMNILHHYIILVVSYSNTFMYQIMKYFAKLSQCGYIITKWNSINIIQLYTKSLKYNVFYEPNNAYHLSGVISNHTCLEQRTAQCVCDTLDSIILLHSINHSFLSVRNVIYLVYVSVISNKRLIDNIQHSEVKSFHKYINMCNLCNQTPIIIFQFDLFCINPFSFILLKYKFKHWLRYVVQYKILPNHAHILSYETYLVCVKYIMARTHIFCRIFQMINIILWGSMGNNLINCL